MRNKKKVSDPDEHKYDSKFNRDGAKQKHIHAPESDMQEDE